MKNINNYLFLTFCFITNNVLAQTERVKPISIIEKSINLKSNFAESSINKYLHQLNYKVTDGENNFIIYCAETKNTPSSLIAFIVDKYYYIFDSDSILTKFKSSDILKIDVVKPIDKNSEIFGTGYENGVVGIKLKKEKNNVVLNLPYLRSIKKI